MHNACWQTFFGCVHILFLSVHVKHHTKLPQCHVSGDHMAPDSSSAFYSPFFAQFLCCTNVLHVGAEMKARQKWEQSAVITPIGNLLTLRNQLRIQVKWMSDLMAVVNWLQYIHAGLAAWRVHLAYAAQSGRLADERMLDGAGDQLLEALIQDLPTPSTFLNTATGSGGDCLYVNAYWFYNVVCWLNASAALLVMTQQPFHPIYLTTQHHGSWDLTINILDCMIY